MQNKLQYKEFLPLALQVVNQGFGAGFSPDRQRPQVHCLIDDA
jgi:hypothetical protein